ncbi:FIT family protein scs3 [Podospora aff. communis PSN243]|uniref:FIT family protein scs3 n=1 Tax=Podospora aff. communis PSN243 TaxID=3040156 RepID=A0AAV9GEA6_9PEZI|nr:FIT family protein scs3 [Podospora aff. communis PSN243]
MNNPHATHRLKTPSQIAASMTPPSAFPGPSANLGQLQPARNNPYLPTPTELALLAGYPVVLLFGALFSLVSPQTRAAPYDAIRHAHIQDSPLVPSYFARKDNLLNILFVKRGWAWITVAFFVFVFTHPALGTGARRARATVRWAVVTTWWIFVTQWFFGPAIIDRGFRWSGGKCEVAGGEVDRGTASTKEVFTNAACKSVGGRWAGGHDISGHVFLLVLGSFFLVQEVGWVAARWARYVREERSVVMGDGAVKGAGVEKEEGKERRDVAVTALEALGRGGSFAAAVIGLCGWMLLMTAIYFHTCLLDSSWLSPGCTSPTSSRDGCLRFGSFYSQPTRFFLPQRATRPGPNMSSTSDTMAPVKFPPNLTELVKTSFAKALASGDVNFYPTQVTLLNINSIPFQLRYSPSLANKPKPPPSNPSQGSTPKHPFNPFASPSPAMLITPLEPTHNLILNKFAIVPEHLILATKEFKPQTHLLEGDDLAASYALINAYQDAGKELFAFFNSGVHSGASQPHRHLQFLDVEGMRGGLDSVGDGERWGVVAGRLAKGEEEAGKLPFRAFAEGIHKGMDGGQLREVYLRLYRRACEALGVDGTQKEGEARVSYNLAMTREVMAVVPRVAEGAEVRKGDEVVGKLALNGTVLAGTALVKTQAEWETLREDPSQVVEVLKKISVPTDGLGTKL